MAARWFLSGGTSTAVPRAARAAAKGWPLKPLVREQVTRGWAGCEQVFGGLALVDRGGPDVLRARSIRLPRLVRTASRKPQNHSACAASRPNRPVRSLPGS